MAERLSFYDEIRNNKLKSLALIIIIFLFFILLAYVISLALNFDFFIISIFATIFSIFYILISYYNADKIALASVKARPADHIEHKMLFNTVESMSIASGLPMPKVYVMDSEQINAFASGRDPQHSVICVTSGALQKLTKQELEGVIAHEMSHVANYDIRFMTLTAVLVGMVSIIAQIYLRSLWFSSMDRDRRDNRLGVILFIISIIVAILAPLAANLVSFAISRKREFTADATGVKFTRYPPGLRDALLKIKKEHFIDGEKHKFPKAMAPLFISDPFKKKISGMFATHPSIDERIRRL